MLAHLKTRKQKFILAAVPVQIFFKYFHYQSDASRGRGGNSALGNKLVQSSVSWFQAKAGIIISTSNPQLHLAI